MTIAKGGVFTRNKKRLLFAVCFTVLLIFTVCAIFYVKSNEKYHISGNIKRMDVKSSLDFDPDVPMYVTDENDIKVLLKCIRQIKNNNKNYARNLSTAPHFYEITVTFENGSSKVYNYTVLPSLKNIYPFKEFYELPFIQAQTSMRETD